MRKKISTYEELLAEKQNLEVLFRVQQTLVKLEIDELKTELDPAFNALAFLKKLTIRNRKNPVLQTGANILIEVMNNKLLGENAGFLRTTVVPYVLKNYASSLLAGHADGLIEKLVSLFSSEDNPVEEA